MFFSAENDISKQIITQCNVDVDCTIEQLSIISKTKDESTVLQTYDDLMSHYVESVDYCHVFAHHAGMFLYHYYDDPSKALSLADTRCGGAQYHGILETYLSTLDVIEGQNISQLCSLTFSENTRKYFECTHGMGHGLVRVYNYDLSSSLNTCNEFDMTLHQKSCARGVFMENMINQANSDYDGLSEDLHFPCNSVDSTFVAPCYMYQSNYIIIKSNYSAKASFDECHKSDPENIKFCYAGIGHQLAPKLLDDFETLSKICQSGQKDFQSYCISGAAYVVIDHKSLEHGFDFCKTTPDYTKNSCYLALGNWIKVMYEENEFKTMCSNAENLEYADVCLDASLEILF